LLKKIPADSIRYMSKGEVQARVSAARKAGASRKEQASRKLQPKSSSSSAAAGAQPPPRTNQYGKFTEIQGSKLVRSPSGRVIAYGETSLVRALSGGRVNSRGEAPPPGGPPSRPGRQ
jgi:hypothetical protein